MSGSQQSPPSATTGPTSGRPARTPGPRSAAAAFERALTRRALVQAAGLAAAAVPAAALLAGCGSDGDGDSGGAGRAGGTTPATGASSGGAATALVKASAVPVGGGVVLQAQKLVVVQPAAGTFKAFDATCTHQSCLVARVADKTIQCDCHGSRFSITDGSVQKPPATAPLREVPITKQGDEILLA